MPTARQKSALSCFRGGFRNQQERNQRKRDKGSGGRETCSQGFRQVPFVLHSHSTFSFHLMFYFTSFQRQSNTEGTFHLGQGAFSGAVGNHCGFRTTPGCRQPRSIRQQVPVECLTPGPLTCAQRDRGGPSPSSLPCLCPGGWGRQASPHARGQASGTGGRGSERLRGGGMQHGAEVVGQAAREGPAGQRPCGLHVSGWAVS